MIETKQLFGTIDVHSRKKKSTMEVSGDKVLQNISICVKQKKETHT